jgi:hypothetical protein
MVSYLPSLLCAPYILGGRGSNLGLHRGECRKPKNMDNSRDRAKGMREYWVRDGMIVWRHGDITADPDGAMLIWAGTEKAALKKARLLMHQRS